MMSTGSKTATMPATPSPPNFVSRMKISLNDRDNRRTQSLRERGPSKTTNMADKMTSQHSRRESNVQQQGSPSGSTIARSMSRYRRRTSSVTVNVDATQKINSDPPPPWDPPIVPPVPTIPRPLRTASSITQKETDVPAASPLPNSPPRHQLRHTESTRRQTLRRSMADQYQSRPSTAKSAKSARSEESAWRRLASRDGRRNRHDSEAEEEAKREIARLEAENHQLLIEQKKKELQRLEVQLANNQKTTQSQSHKQRSPVIEKFVLLTKGRKNKDGLSPGISPASSTTSFEPSKMAPMGIEPGGRGIVPQTDAPHSAINAGDRNVAVRYRQHTLSLEVTPETTSDDIIFQTSEAMGTDEINPTNCVVVETYSVLGLERRLRRYESIRDVMNSWDRDTQNQLVVTLSDSEEQNRELDIDSAPKRNEPPQGFQLYMYHSNRPGKWNKRWIALLENGQVLCAKKPNANSTDKDTTNLCRLSDYDIYTPTESQMRRHIKPPKRFCFAVKSQQRTTVFMNTENYVQYFCTEDPQIAAQFREKVQSWRSWYLVGRIPVAPKTPRKISIRKTDDKPPQITLPAISRTPKKTENVATLNGHRLRVSVDETPYAIGQFEPLLDMKRFDKRLSQFGKDFLPPPPVPDVSTMPKEIPAHHLNSGSKREKREKDSRSDLRLIDSIHSASNDGFTGSGLLGGGYEERKRDSDRLDRGRQVSKDDGFIEGPSLLNRKSEPEPGAHGPDSPSWFPSALEHSARARSITSSSSSSARPSTSAGVVRTHTHTHQNSHTRRPSLSSSSRPPLPLSGKPQAHEHPHPLSSQPTGLSHSNRRDRPKPLVNLESGFQEAPQWAKNKSGHGVKAPEGTAHLIDLITVPNSSKPNGIDPEVPPRSALRRPPNTAPLPGLSRTRSKTQGAPPPRSPINGDVPPVPSLPKRVPDWEPLRSHPPPRSRDRERTREKEREYSAYNSVSGRTGTLKVV
ncbi:uncharacterized protein F4822DRAFT_185466 [Hypoxylon trugodes]|uniref:uncharacterized protein n=1 Tax=Hypoxylon trugodes TaxID=326681 RepID=UPI00218F4304|nr:uncharacterized protein F4822DRAFT_185466 [Hypoxylon trugodes]KAI1391426.1 hypothetical protein F4822DRAFT_185466 [Hypoxylon trugodes]